MSDERNRNTPQAAGVPRTPRIPERTQSAFRCGLCGSGLIYPIESCQVASATWMVDLRCAECPWRGAVQHTEAELEELDRELDRAASEIESHLNHLETLHMEEWVEQFRKAIWLDLIDADDFARRVRSRPSDSAAGTQ
jgi:hypothetical protein